MANGGGTGWSYRIGSGLLTAANSGVVMASGALQMINLPPGAYVPFVGRNAAESGKGRSTGVRAVWMARRKCG